MNHRAIRYFLAQILRIEAVFIIPALVIAVFDWDWGVVHSLGVTAVFAMTLSFLLTIKTKGDRSIYAKEGFVIVALSWIVLSLIGALPFWISRQIPSFIDAFFETVSGFTTTGATILTDVEALDRGLLYWRSFTHWLGGMGVLVFLLAIIPLAKGNGSSMHILRAESPGPTTDKLTPKMRQSARILYLIYVALTAIEFIMLLLGGMPWFDSLTLSFGTAGTGGFGVLNSSIASYSAYCQTVIAVFMMLFGVSFSIYYLLLMGQFKDIWKNEELKAYLGLMLGSTLLITINILPLYPSFADAFHSSFFQVSSIMTTTGYTTVNFDLWPQFSRTLLVMLMFVGACAGSTGGGIKVSRVLLMFKSLRYGLKKMIHPRAVEVIRLDQKRMDESSVATIGWYVTGYLAIMVGSVLLVSLDGFSFETGFTAVTACFNNIGPGLDMVGPIGNYSQFSVLSKLVLSFDMLFGRLEIFPLFFLFSNSVWTKR